MEKELKLVQRYFPAANLCNMRFSGSNSNIVIIFETKSDAITIIISGDTYFVCGYDSHDEIERSNICYSKDFSKILGVLKAIKLCEENNDE